jgi:isoleucyl-tRNA synthetase
MFKPVPSKVNFPRIEEKILHFWKKNKIFEKSITQGPKEREFVFYDGPPFATGLPHYGHIVPGTMKDIIPRYWTMKGYRVERRFGWDCHGLPVEYEMEKELRISGKREIEEMGVDKFNKACRGIVLRYAKEWEWIVPRLGRWVDFKNHYRTMDPEYMESIWWVFKTLWEKGLIYEGYKSVHLCPRCATPLSNFEVAQGYKDKTDKSVVVKFQLEHQPNTFILAWTTTPWTLPGNILLAINPRVDYVEVQKNKEKYILARDRVKEVFGGGNLSLKKISARELVGQKYKPLFEITKRSKKAYELVRADFVSTEEGTGVVHIAPAFGEDDLLIGQKEKVDFTQYIDVNGRVTAVLPEFRGISVFKLNEKVTEYLSKKGMLFSSLDIVHSYPHCWRCDTPLLNYAMKSWFVKATKIKDKLIANNQKIHWIPLHIRDGRFGRWLEGIRDWAISRNRYWGTPLPVWRCDKSGEIEVLGSISELEKKADVKLDDLHLHKIQKITWVNPKTGGTMYLSGEVLDCWFESGSMPYASNHYPFENKEKFEGNFPADFIAEGIDQTRGWFYTLHVLATALFGKPAFKNCATHGVVLAEDGSKMSKRKRNYPDPMEIVKKYGADALRFYLMASPVVRGEDLRFSEKGVANVVRSHFLILWNIYRFFVTYSNVDKWRPKQPLSINKQLSVLDKWILSRIHETVLNTTYALEDYDIFVALKNLPPLIKDLSTWYVRSSRERVGPTAQNEEDKNICFATLYTALITLSKLLAPFVPFLAEELYQNLKVAGSRSQLVGDNPPRATRRVPSSVHLSSWPKANESLIDKKLEERMSLVRKICELGHAERKRLGIKVRQPLRRAKCKLQRARLLEGDKELTDLIKRELNLKEIEFVESETEKFELETKITLELAAEGKARDLIRQIQELRKRAGCKLDEKVIVYTPTWPKGFEDYIKQKTLAKKLSSGKKPRVVRERQ